jgi:hypothetical protein
MFKRAANPFWMPSNLTKHFKKRFNRDSHCWKALTNTKNFTTAIYEAQSKKIISTCWLCFKAKMYAPKEKEYYRLSKYHTDKKIALTITDIKTDEIITCYHEHFGRPCTLSSGSSKALEAEDQIKHIRHLKHNIKSRMIEQFAVGNPAQTPASGIQVKIDELMAS